MWIEKTKSGLRMCERFEGPDGRMHRASVPLKKDTASARKAATAELLDKIQRSGTPGTRQKLSALIEIYFEKIDVKPATLHSYRMSLGQCLNILGDIPADNLTAPYIKRSLLESNKKARTLNVYVGALNTFLKWCHEYGYIPEPVKVSKYPDKTRRRDPDAEYLERSELVDILDQLNGTVWYYIIKFLALTGCRVGELSALTPDDVGSRYISINKTRIQLTGAISTPKTADSAREIYIQPELRELLNEWKQFRSVYMMAHGIRSDLLFFSAAGSWISTSGMRYTLGHLKSDKHLHPHIFRHSHVAYLAEEGIPLDVIARRLGHSKSETTRQIYFHVTEKLKARDEAAISKIHIV